MDLSTKIKKLPHKPGVYLYKNKDGEVIYVGKAISLNRRVHQYFQKNITNRKTLALVKDIVDLETIQTETELDALFLESELVKRYKPKYNILLRDDKSQIYIKFSDDLAPVISYTRLPLGDGEYFGPYYNAYPIKKAMRYLRRIFPYLLKKYEATSPLEFDINLAPRLENDGDFKKYQANLKQIKRFINGKRLDIVKDLEVEMKLAASYQNFEEAAKLRNKIYQLKSLAQKIHINSLETNLEDDEAITNLRDLFSLNEIPKRIEGYDVSHMSGTNVVASMVVMKNGIADKSSYRRFKIKVDKNNDFYNMQEVLNRRLSDKNIKDWGLPNLIMVDGGKGQLTSGIKIRDENGLSIPMIGLAKRNEELIVHKKSNVTINVKKAVELKARIYEEGDFQIVVLNDSNSIIKLFKRLRDEAHRFAITYHGKLKTRAQTESILDEIKGIGNQTKTKLMHKFKSVNKISQASLEELNAIIGKQKAQIIFNFFSDKNR